MAFRSSCRVIIVGAGLGGLAVAIGIRKAGFAVLVLEKIEELREVVTAASQSLEEAR